MSEQKGKWIGALVRTNRDIQTRGGTKFRAGVLMHVSDSTSGGLNLYCFKRGHVMSVHGISKNHVTVIKWPNKEDADEA